LHASVTLEDICQELRCIRQDMQRFMPYDPWEQLSCQTTASKKCKLRDNLKVLYHMVACVVSGVVDNDSDDANPNQRVVAAHLWPKSQATRFESWKATISSSTCAGIDDASNGLFLLKEIEEAYDKKRVCFVCNPFDISMEFKVLDKNLLLQKPAGCSQTYEELSQSIIRSPTINNIMRPSFHILSRHAFHAVDHASLRTWVTPQQKTELHNLIKVSSPQKIEDV
jgi:HNH endonuclease